MASNGDDSATESEEFFSDQDVEKDGGDDLLGGVNMQSSSSSLPIAAAADVESDSDASHVVAINGVKQELRQPVERLDEPKALVTTPRSASTSIYVAPLVAPSATAASVLSDASGRPDATAVKDESNVAAMHHPVPPIYAPESKSSSPVIQSSSTLNTAPSYTGAKSTHWSPVLPASYGGSEMHTSPYPVYNGGAAPFRSHPPVTGGAPGAPAQQVYGYCPPPPVDHPPPRTIQSHYQNLPASEVFSINTSAKPKAASSAVTSVSPTPPPPKILPPLSVQQSQQTAPVPTQANTAHRLTSATSAPAPTAPSPVATGPKCPSCKLVLYKVQPSSVTADNLQCSCCKKLLLADACFSRNQRATGKNRCKACLGQANLDASDDPLPTQPLGKKAQKIQLLQSREGMLGAERQVAKYHLARRSLQRKREANDLRGSTRVEYEKQLAKEDAELKALEKQLRAKYPQLFDKHVGIQVRPPPIPRKERDRPLRTKKSKKLAERAEQRAKKKKEQQATVAVARAAAGSSVTSTSAFEVVNLTDEPGSEANDQASTSLTPPTTKAATAKVKVTKPKTTTAAKAAAKPKAVVKEKAAAKPATTSTAVKKRKEAAASTSTLAAKEKPTKKPKTSKTTTSASTAVAESDGMDADPWLVAHDEIAQGLSQLLGGNLDNVLRATANGSSGSSKSKKKPAMATAAKKEKKPVAKPAANAKAPCSQVKQEAKTDEAAVQQQHVTIETPPVTTTNPTTFSRAVAAASKTERVKSEDSPTPIKVKNGTRPDPSSCVPKTKLQAETPPRTTIVTCARKRALEPAPAVEIIDITDSPKSGSSSEKKLRSLP